MIEAILCALGFHAWTYPTSTARRCRRQGCQCRQILLLSVHNKAGEWLTQK
jgi:hypothetical protein